MNGYTFFVDDGVGEVQVTPAIGTLTFVYEPDRDFGYYRLSIAEDMPFTGADYTFLKGLDDAGCGTYDFIVKYLGNEVYRGLLRVQANTALDLRDCIFRATIEPQDAYTCLVENWEQEFNIFIGTAKYRAKTLLGTIATVTCTNDVSASNILVVIAMLAPNGCLTAPTGAWALERWTIEQIGIDLWRSQAVWVREETTTDCVGGSPAPPPGGGWVLVADRCGVDNESDWARTPAMVEVFFENDGIRYEERYEIASEDVEYGNGVRLNDVLETFAPCGLDVVSDFFSLDGDDTHPSNGAYTAAKANLMNVLIYQKSDVRLPDAISPASSGRWTYKSLLEHLKFQYNVEPRIIAGVLRLEHVSYWAASPGLDLTASPYVSFVGTALGYAWDNENLAKLERWSFMEPVSVTFTGRPIEYADCVPQRAQSERPYNMNRINNDISYITANPDLASDDGFSFVATANIKGDIYILSEPPIPLNVLLSLNGHHAIGNLLDKYHRWDRLLPTGNLNGNIVTFASSLPRRVQPDFSIIYNRALFHSTYIADAYVVTELGNGEVAQARYEAYSCTFTFSLKYA
jgi:hypothetical protein